MSHDDENEHPLINHAARIMKATVTRVGRVSPHMVEVTIAGDDLRQFPLLGPDQFLYLFVPRPGMDDPGVEYDFDWAQWREMPADSRPIGRYYTVRRLRRESGEIDLHMVLHGHGPLTTWAAGARPGERVALWGPRAAYRQPPPGTPLVLAADEAGLPALAAILESLPADARGRACIETASQEDWQDLAAPPGFEVTWLAREDRPYGEPLLATVTRSPLPDGLGYAWAAGEAGLVKELRRFFRQQAGLPGEAVCAIGYWQRDHAPA